MAKQKQLATKIINRFLNAFTVQSVRRTLRAAKVPPVSVPIIVGLVREANRHIQWGNGPLWNRRIAKAKEFFAEFKQKQNEISPVYRFRGGSRTVSPFLSHETVRDKLRDPNLNVSSRKSRFDPSAIFLGGLGFVVFASLAGPAIAKQINTVDPLDARETQLSVKPANLGIDLRS